jgi:hypothetical protein
MEIGSMIWCNDDPPPQGLSEARRGKEVSCICIFYFLVIDPPRGRPFGAAGFIVSGGMGVSTPITINEFCFSVETHAGN